MTRQPTPGVYENYREPGEFGEGVTVRRAEATRPIVGIENRTAKEVFDIMCDRIHTLTARQEAVEQMNEGALNDLSQDLIKLQARCDAQEATLRKIAAYDDAAANAYLRATGSYRCFDEPGAVEMARGVLEGQNDAS